MNYLNVLKKNVSDLPAKFNSMESTLVSAKSDSNSSATSAEATYLKTQFEEYKTTVGEHIKDLDYLLKSEPQFRRISNNISSKCDYIIVDFYD